MQMKAFQCFVLTALQVDRQVNVVVIDKYNVVSN